MFWNSTSYHTPEDRMEIAERVQKIEEKKNNSRKEEEKPKTVIKLFNPKGKPYNVNQPKVAFTLNDEDRENIILDVQVYK